MIMRGAAVVLAGFLIGAIPFSFLLARLLGGVDIRKVGSGNIGATNLSRSLGYRIGLAAFVLDAAKGAAAVLVAAVVTEEAVVVMGAAVLAEAVVPVAAVVPGEAVLPAGILPEAPRAAARE